MGLAFVFQALAATLFAVAAVAGLAALLLWSPFAALFGLVFAALPAVFGLCAFVVLRRFTPVRGWMAVLCGFLLGAVPAFVVGFSPAAGFASANGVETVINGRYTLWGWFGLVKSVVLIGGFGAIGGLVFWLVMRAGPVLRGRRAETSLASGLGRSSIWLAAAIVVVATMASLPLIAKDRSCHNTGRDEEIVVTPRFSAVLAIGPDDWQDLEGVLRAFAAAEGWSLRSQFDPRGTPLGQFHATLCTEPGTMIMFMKDFLPPDVASRLPGGHNLRVTVYQPRSLEGWQDPTADLMGRLAQRWPGRLSFLGERGLPAPPPDWLLPLLPPNWAAEAGS